MTHLKLIRKYKKKNYTIGHLYYDGVYFCDTIEDAVRTEKIKHKTAIPAGTYIVQTTYSERFQRWMPQLMNVPGFAGIRIHNGNTAADTSGCILVGENRLKGRLIYSKSTFLRLFDLIDSKPCQIKITDN
jgi:hypothetical protein